MTDPLFPADNISIEIKGQCIAAFAVNNSLYVDSTDGKLYWKDGSGVSHVLYLVV